LSEKKVREYYSRSPLLEWKRLQRDPYHRLEFDTTMHFLKKYLPGRGSVLDAGGGPGRYTIELARLGYEVVLLDLTPENLELARTRIARAGVRRGVKGVVKGSVADLSGFADKSFDSVICLGGALSHVVNKRRREKAISEFVRVSKRGAPIFISVIGRIGLLVSELMLFPQEIEIHKLFGRARDTGDYRGGYGFAPCHFYLPEELKLSLEEKGLRILEIAGLEGLASGHRKETNRLARGYPKAWKVWWETHLETCTHPAAVGISEHFLAVCRK
jgi:SAM-dependent methyltransferase